MISSLSIIYKYRMHTGFEKDKRELAPLTDVGFLCSYINPLTGFYRVIDYDADEKVRLRYESEGYTMADYETFRRGNIRSRLRAERNLRIQQDKIKKDLEWLDASLELRPDRDFVEFPKKSPIDKSEDKNLQLLLLLRNARIDSD